jgi:molybdate transport system ATP-binding protein
VSGLELDLRGVAGAQPIEAAFRVGETPLVIVGPNGAGKTSLLMMILGALRPTAGRLVLDDRVLFDGQARVEVPVEGRRIGFLPQRYALFPHLDAAENVAYGITEGSRTERRRLAIEALEHLDVAALAARRPAGFSGGEAQRVALARALARRPRALLLDEPFAALDASVRREVRRFLAARLLEWRLPTIVVTHDRADAETFAGVFDSQLVVLERGAIVQTGRLEQLTAAPRTAFVARFVAGDGPAPPGR